MRVYDAAVAQFIHRAFVYKTYYLMHFVTVQLSPINITFHSLNVQGTLYVYRAQYVNELNSIFRCHCGSSNKKEVKTFGK